MSNTRKPGAWRFALIAEKTKEFESGYLQEDEVQQALIRLFQGKTHKAGSDLRSAIVKAMALVNTLIAAYPDAFVEGAKGLLDDYCVRATKNIEACEGMMKALASDKNQSP